MGCSEITATATKLRGPGTVSTIAPSAGNGWRGTLHIADDCVGYQCEPNALAHVYDIRVTLQCVGGGGASMPQTPVRLSCTHNQDTDSCHMGRIEVYQPNAVHLTGRGRGTWGTICAFANTLILPFRT